MGIWSLYIHTEDQTGHWISSSIALCLIALRQSLLLSQARLARELSVFAYHCPPALGLLAYLAMAGFYRDIGFKFRPPCLQNMHI